MSRCHVTYPPTFYFQIQITLSTTNHITKCLLNPKPRVDSILRNQLQSSSNYIRWDIRLQRSALKQTSQNRQSLELSDRQIFIQTSLFNLLNDPDVLLSSIDAQKELYFVMSPNIPKKLSFHCQLRPSQVINFIPIPHVDI
jgi:hypothetical protein